MYAAYEDELKARGYGRVKRSRSEYESSSYHGSRDKSSSSRGYEREYDRRPPSPGRDSSRYSDRERSRYDHRRSDPRDREYGSRGSSSYDDGYGTYGRSAADYGYNGREKESYSYASYSKPPSPPYEPPEAPKKSSPPSFGSNSSNAVYSHGGGDTGASGSRESSRPGPSGGGDSGGGQRGPDKRAGRSSQFLTDILMTRAPGFDKKGSSGRSLKLTANFFELIQAGKWYLNQYHVDFHPDVEGTGKRKGLVRRALKDISRTGYLFDGTQMFTTQKFPQDPFQLTVALAEGSEEEIRLTIRLVGDLAWTDPHYMQLFNLIVRKCLSFMKLKLLGRNYFDPESRIRVPEYKLELWPGYVTSMRRHEQNIMMNVDVSCKVMRTDTVYDILMECSRSPNCKEDFKKKVLGSIVLTYYNNKTYRIDDVDFDTTPEDSFESRDKTQIQYLDYYKTKYNINIRVKSQPMLVSMSKPREIRAGLPDKLYLVPELCQMTGLTDAQRDNFQLMKRLGEHTRVGPRGRVDRLMEFSSRLNRCPEAVEEIRRWDLKLANRLVEFEARTLNEDEIVMGDNRKSRTNGDRAEWNAAFRNTPMFRQDRIDCYAVIVPAKLRHPAMRFVDAIKRCAEGMRWRFDNQRVIDIYDDRPRSYLDAVDKACQVGAKIIIVILPQNSADRYNSVKKKCSIERGIPTQMVLAKQFNAKGVMSVATKIAIQMNCKVGGAPWSITIPTSGLMIVGYDVARDKVDGSKSYVAMVASMDKDVSRYYAHTTEYHNDQELCDAVRSFILLTCYNFRKNSSAFPDKIIIYRNGESEGQIPNIFKEEIPNIKKKLSEEIYTQGNLKMAYILVSKKVNTRFFMGDRNPPPGTVIDDVVTLPERYDFYIVSQCVRQGAVAPTYYNVIEDSIRLPADRLQMLTYKLCHMYYNWSGTVRVPAPCQYAQKLASLTASCLHRRAHKDLLDKLFFL